MGSWDFHQIYNHLNSWDYNVIIYIILIIIVIIIIIVYIIVITGWWLSPTPLKNDGVRQWEG
jgi:uncharacterized membrane protein YfhO